MDTLNKLKNDNVTTTHIDFKNNTENETDYGQEALHEILLTSTGSNTYIDGNGLFYNYTLEDCANTTEDYIKLIGIDYTICDKDIE